jgi:hypothetical protein
LLFQWLYGESLRREKEVASLDRTLSATIIPCGTNTLLLTVEALWKNHSPFQIDLDIRKCLIEVFLLDRSALKEATVLVLLKQEDWARKRLNKDERHNAVDAGQPICERRFLKDFYEGYYRLEPNTASPLNNYFVLTPDLYGIRMVLYRNNKEGNWRRDLVVDVQAPKG